MPQVDCVLDDIEAVGLEHCDGICSDWVGPGSRGVVFVLLEEFGEVNFSQDCGVHGVQKWPLVHLLCNGEGKELDESSLIMCMIE